MLAIQPASSAWVSADQHTTDLPFGLDCPVGLHLLAESIRDRLGERVRGRDDLGPASPVRRDRELGDVGVALLEPDDVADVRPAPLIDRLVVIAHHAQFRRRRRSTARSAAPAPG